ncbi:MAG TPA: hypothetical protein VLB44_18480 [Kofleriaceae bacterium]|nr:hypothetical protein [Kofleriaceae bacterium]
MRMLVGLYLMVVSATAFAEAQPAPQAPQAVAPQPAPPQPAPPQPAPPLPRDRCAVVPPKGTPIFEARYNGGTNGRGVVTRLYATGTYTRTVTKPKGRPDQQLACIEKGRLGNLMVAIKSASWKTTQSAATCTAVSAEATDILVFGKKRFTAKVCSSLALDDKSSAALGQVATAVGPFGVDLVDDLPSD